MRHPNRRLEHLTPAQNASCSGHSDPRYRHWVYLTGCIAFVVYLAGVSSFPATILMGQDFDDALYIRLGLNIANGNWSAPTMSLPWSRLPCFRYSSAFSFTGIPFNIAQHCLFFPGVRLPCQHRFSRLQVKGGRHLLVCRRCDVPFLLHNYEGYSGSTLYNSYAVSGWKLD